MSVTVAFSFQGHRFSGPLSTFPGFDGEGDRDLCWPAVLNVCTRLPSALPVSEASSPQQRATNLAEPAIFRMDLSGPFSTLRDRVEDLAALQQELSYSRSHPIEHKLWEALTVAMAVGLIALSIFLMTTPSWIARIAGGLLFLYCENKAMLTMNKVHSYLFMIMNPDRADLETVARAQVNNEPLSSIYLYFTRLSHFESVEQSVQDRPVVRALNEFMGIWGRVRQQLRETVTNGPEAVELVLPQHQQGRRVTKAEFLRELDRWDGLYERFNQLSTNETAPSLPETATG